MLFEDIILLLMSGAAVFFIGIPIFKFIRVIAPPKRNPLEEAKERLELARLEAEAARLNKETEKVIETMYEETLQDEEDETKNNRRIS
jgi:hypothetical protein